MNVVDIIPLMVRSRTIRDPFARTLAADNGDGWGSTNTGQSWIALQQKSTMIVDSALGAGVTSAATRAMAVLNPGVTDVDVAVRFSSMTGTTTGGQGIVVRAIDVANHVYVRVGTTSTSILTSIATNFVSRATAAMAFNPATDTIRVQVVGDSYTVFKNDAPFLYWYDNVGPGGTGLFSASKLHGLVLTSSAARVREIIIAPLDFATPASLDPTFRDGYQQNSLAEYNVVFHAETASFITDPLKVGGQRVLKCDVPNTAIGPTANPRVQLSAKPVLYADSEVWAGFAVMFPSGTGPTAGMTPFPAMPDGFSGFMNINQFYTANPESSPPVKLGFRAGSGRELMWQRNATYGNDRPWSLGHPVEFDKVYELAWHVKMSNDPTIGFAELYKRESKAEGWVQQTLFAGTAQATQRLMMRTMDSNANSGPNRHDVQLYRSVNMFDNVTILFYGHRIGNSLADVDTGYYA
ncbi:hypothetical protein ACFZA2_01715 [Microbacterium sp. NPDC007973]|uniref:hypothetical protein n=1 Tax=Microbacterium sp. NPDC007973 TaxID=3364182 RepID=UPI0036DFBFBF